MITITCGLLVVWSYLRDPHYRTHPNGYFAWISFCDILFGFVNIIVPANEKQEDVCTGISGEIESFTSEFSLLSSLFTYLAFLYNLLANLQNPFLNVNIQKFVYNYYIISNYVIIFLLSLIGAIVNSSIPSVKRVAGMCWFVTSIGSYPDLGNILFFYVPVCVTLFLSVILLIYIQHYMKYINKDELKKYGIIHYDVLLYGHKMVISHLIYWVICGITYVIVVVINKGIFDLNNSNIWMIINQIVYIYNIRYLL